MLKSSAKTDPGKRRSNNEDSLLTMEAERLFVVADGVGGRAAGEVASRICVETFASAAAGLAIAAGALNRTPGFAARNAVLSGLEQTCQVASRKVFETAEAQGFNGMTTTMVALLLTDNTAFIAHVGDSRCYLLRGGVLTQLTEDHSMVNELIKNGEMTREDARRSRYRHIITRAIGAYPTVQPSLAAVDVRPGDRFLLCSDGLSDVVAEADILERAVLPDLDASVDALLQSSLDAGAPDNVTVILVDPAGTEASDPGILRAHTLDRLPLFEGIPFQARLQLARIMEERRFLPGEVLVTEDTVGRTLLTIVEGDVLVERNGVELARFSAGAHVGEVSLVDDQPRSATVRALTPVVAVSLEGSALENFCVQEPALGNLLLWRLMTVLTARLRNTNDRLAAPQRA